MNERTLVQRFITDGNDKDWWAYVDTRTRRRMRNRRKPYLRSVRTTQLTLFRKKVGRVR